MRRVPAGTGLARRFEGRSPPSSGMRVPTWARAPFLGRSAWAWAGRGGPRACAPARLRAAGHVPSGLRAPPPGPGVPGDARAADAGGGAGRGRRGALTRRPRPSGVQNRSLGLGCVREEGSSCLVAYKKTPPPVPPRTTSKPFISVTVQSSTESAQDTYLDSQDHKSEVTSQSGLSNSSDSLDSSTRPPSVTRGGVAPAPEAPEPPPKHASLKSEQGTLTSSESHPEAAPKRKLSSIGIQERTRRNGSHLSEDNGPKAIDVMAPSSESSVPSHSMSSRRDTDSDTQDANDSSCKSSERSLPDCTPHPNSISIDAGPRQAPKIAQIKRNLSYGDNSDPALEASSLPPPDPWLETSSSSPAEPAQPGACRRDGYWFLKLLQAETERLEGWCCQMDKETKENNLSEEVLGKVLSAVGSAQLLMSQKFQQFRGLCEQNLNPDANPRPTAQDLAGFWDLLQLSIEDISMKFDELYHLKANSWQLVETPEKRKEEKKPPPPVPKKPAKSKPAVSRDKASDASDKQRQEARKRLLAAKRAASVRQNSATESADSIEIYVPEAQTRL
ncbi:disks large-associated protein 4 isoform X12 [Macaca fascicularis]|uniref:disks large-associated protein 4 isoform X12 n=1 Tax=Macaca fascicularis TaxID=9541 RepID=UPI003D154E76